MRRPSRKMKKPSWHRPAEPLFRTIRILYSSLLLLLPVLAAGCLSPVSGPPMEPIVEDATGVAGVVRNAKGRPAAGAFVYAYRSASHGLRGPADFGIRVERDGRYFLDLVEGEYHLVARLRQTGADAGPPRPGDAWSLYPKNPVRVEPGRVANIDFTLQGGTVPRQVRQGSLTTGDTGFRGTLVDGAGQPFTGAFALAYRTPDFHRMPDFTSTPADSSGAFILYVPEAGEYCLAARSKTRGQPRAGEPYGQLDRGGEACLAVAPGEVVDVGRIVLTPYP